MFLRTGRLALILGLFVVSSCNAQAPIGGIPCDTCLGLDAVTCSNTRGCFWSDRISTCGNSCEYVADSDCCVLDALGNPQSGCCRLCRWLGGGLSSCIIRWDFHFDVCFVVDASESITLPEWNSILQFFIVQYIQAITPDACDLTNPDISGFCPHVGVVQYDSIAQTIIPNLASLQGYYNETSSCFRRDTTLNHLHPGWENIVRGMKRSQDQARPAGGNTWTVLAVQRCADLLVNTYLRQPKTLSLLVVMTDGSPNGPSRCAGDVCDICGPNPEKEDFLLPPNDLLFQYDASCVPQIAGETFTEQGQLQKLLNINARRILVLFKPEVDAFKNDVKLLCLIEGQPGSFANAFQVPTPLLQNVSDPALQAAVGIIIKNLSDTVCEFSVAPTLSPTSQPSVTPTKAPTPKPSDHPTKRPSTNPTVTPTKPPSKNPTKFPTKFPSKTPSKSPTLSPTGCQGPPPDIARPNCKTMPPNQNCNGNSAANVLVDFVPLITVNPATQSTTFCFTFESVLSSNPMCAPPNAMTMIQGVSFMMDECCPVNGDMQFLERIDFGNPGTTTFQQYDVRNGECPMISPLLVSPPPPTSSPNPMFTVSGCTRGERVCTGSGTSGQNCSVINVNNVGLNETQGHFCITVPGTKWNTVHPDRIDSGKTELGKICFESGVAPPMGGGSSSTNNICSCFEVEIPKSELLCKATSSPTKAPTPFKCDKDVPDVPPVNRRCSYPCQENEVSEWEPYLYKYEYVMEYDLTYFKYCVDTEKDWYEKKNACVSPLQIPARGGWWWKGQRKKPDAFYVSGLTLRLDECCELCLVKDHFYSDTADEYSIVNLEEGSSYWRINDKPDYEKKCYIIEVNGNIGTQPGLVCVNGGNKCMCAEVPVPYSCDLKKVRDALCHESEQKDSKDYGGRGGRQWGGR